MPFLATYALPALIVFAFSLCSCLGLTAMQEQSKEQGQELIARYNSPNAWHNWRGNYYNNARAARGYSNFGYRTYPYYKNYGGYYRYRAYPYYRNFGGYYGFPYDKNYGGFYGRSFPYYRRFGAYYAYPYYGNYGGYYNPYYTSYPYYGSYYPYYTPPYTYYYGDYPYYYDDDSSLYYYSW